jgi:translocation and assembly module TamB
MGKIFKYIFVAIGWILLLLMVLIIAALIVLQTKPFKEKLVSIIESQSKKYINGDLTIGSLDGDFFTHLSLKNVLLTSDSDTIAYIRELDARYKLAPILHKQIIVTNLRVFGPYIYLEQINDSIWNVQQIMKPTQEGPPDTTAAKSGFDVKLNFFQLTDGAIRIQTPDTLIPHQITKLNTAFSFQMIKDQMLVQMKNLSLLAEQPSLELKKLAFDLKKNPQLIGITHLVLATAQNQLKGEVQYYFDKKDRSTAVLQTTPLHLQEFERYMSGYKFPATPVLDAKASMQNDSVDMVIDMTDQKQRINLRLLSSNLYKWLVEKSDSILNYNLNGKLENVELQHWLGMPKYNYTLNGQLSADGKGTDPKTAVVKLIGTFQNCIVEKKKIDRLNFDTDLDHGNLKGVLNGSGSLGQIDLQAVVNNLFKTPDYQLDLKTSNLDVGPLAGIDTLHSNLNLTANIIGKGIDPKTLSAKAVMNVAPSQIQKIQFNTAKASIDYNQQNINIDSLFLQTQTLSLKANGNYNLKSSSNIILTADLKSMDELKSFVPLADLQTSGHLDAHLSGTKDSLTINAEISLPQTQYGEYLVGPVSATAHAGITPRDTLINAQILAQKITSGDFQLDSASINLAGTKDTALVQGHLVNKDLDTHFQTTLQTGNLTRINLYQLAVNYKNQDWFLTQPPAVIVIGPNDYRIDNLNFSSRDTTQHFTAQGIINRDGNEDFKMQIKNIDIKKLAELTKQNIPASGTLNFNLALNGTASAPIIKGDFGIEKAEINKYNFTEFGGKFDYKAGKLGLDMNIVPKDSGNFTITGKMPFKFRLDSISYNFNRKDPIDLNLDIQKFPVAALGSISMIKQLTGYLDGGVRMLGSIDSPDLKGGLQLKGASVKIPEYGVDYRDMIFNMNFVRDKVQLDTLRIRTDKGNMTGKGEIDFASDFYKGKISNSKINFTFNGFKPINHRQVNMQVTGKTSLGGASGNVVFDGNLTVDNSELYIPALMNMIGKANTSEIPEPLLARALDSLSNNKTDTIIVLKNDSAKNDSAQTNYFKNLKGKIRLKIPKNTWIKNESMYVEISGDLELIKNLSFFELFGSVNIMRGQYELLGRKFVINKGTINFQGGEKMTPIIDLQATYAFRNTQRQKQTLAVDVNGTPDSLAVNFSLDESPINEGDALSYLLFGRGLNELSLEQQQGLGGSGSMAEMVAASLVSSQLTKFLGNKLNVDYIEIKSEGGFENATVTVGKYITRDLFASYEQRFGQTTVTGEATYIVNLEYELTKFLFLQMNNSSIDNGFDVIFKLEAK